LSSLRVGLGVDAHAFEDGVPLVLGGLSFDHPRGLAGHSDGDVVVHALIDALLGAAGLGDIGTLFPADATLPEGVDSTELLRGSCERIRGAGFEIVNAACVLIGQEPRLGDRRPELEARLTAVVGAPVSLGATTTDRLGFTGRGEGLACQAIALLERP